MRSLRSSLVLCLLLAACHHKGGDEDMGAGDLGDDGSANSCLAGGATCATSTECCSNMCDPATSLCAAPMCKPVGEACAIPSDCCNLNCSGGTCGAGACVSDGQACDAAGATCCSGPAACQNGTCQQLGNGCHTAGNACTMDIECCAGRCDPGTKTCAPPSLISYCAQTNDVCYRDSDCCTSICNVGATGAGTCQAIAGAKCLVDGTVCTGCNSANSTTVSKCCSTYCGKYGTTDSSICQPAGGCRIQGDLCQKDVDCCGGASAMMCMLPGDGEVKCEIFDAVRGLGLCSPPSGSTCTSGTCVPEGDVCHCALVDSKGICWDSCPAGETCHSLPSGCSVSGVNANCCGKPGANKMTCRVDAVGVPRCYTIDTCVMPGGACASTADCCDGKVCVPDATGKFVCGATACVPTGGKCTATSDCCPGEGNFCVIPPGETAGVCTNPNPPPPPTDGGTPPDLAGANCSFAGQTCSTTQACCEGNCVDASGMACTTATGCVCYLIL
jgi:hypothetical protein